MSEEVDLTKSVSLAPAESASDEFQPILIHFLEDGFTAFNVVWYRGQELELNQRDYQETLDRNGKSWLELDEGAQLNKFGRILFRRGPWPGKEWPDAEAKAAEQARSRRPPRVTLER